MEILLGKGLRAENLVSCTNNKNDFGENFE